MAKNKKGNPKMKSKKLKKENKKNNYLSVEGAVAKRDFCKSQTIFNYVMCYVRTKGGEGVTGRGK